MDGEKIHRLQLQNQCHDPGEHCCNQNNNDGVSEPFQSGSQIQFCQIDAAGDKWKAWNNKQHGTDITCFMKYRNMKNQFCGFQQAGIDQACGGYGQCNIQEKRKMMLDQFCTQCISANIISEIPPPRRKVKPQQASAAARPRVEGEYRV